MPTEPGTAVLARRLRHVIGIDEDLLDQVPEERPRYTKLGAIVCLTATISALSMLVITSRMSLGAVTWPVALLVMVLWGGLILTIDSWLIASAHGTLKAKVRVYLPRLLIAVLLGFVIAEPLVMSVFRAEIEQQIADNREQELAAVSSRWRTCNPPTDEVVKTPECAGYRLNLAQSPSTLRQQLSDLRKKRGTEATELDRDLNQWKQLDRLARSECAGATDPETTGVSGDGPNCSRNRQTADQYWRDSRLEQRRADVGDMDSRLGVLQDKVTTAEAKYGEQVRIAIVQKIGEWRESRRSIGILEQIKALGQVSANSLPVTVAHWVLRLLLVLIDCLPVLTKWLSGANAYDRMLKRQIDSRVELHKGRVQRVEKVESEVSQAHMATLLREPHEQLADEEEARRQALRERERRRDEEIERLYELYRQEEAP